MLRFKAQVGTFPLVLAVLNRIVVSTTPLFESLGRTACIRGNIPRLIVPVDRLGFGFPGLMGDGLLRPRV